MKNERRVVAMAALAMLAACCFAGISFRQSISLNGGGNFCYPTASYLIEYPGNTLAKNPPMRTCAAGGIDLALMSLSYERKVASLENKVPALSEPSVFSDEGGRSGRVGDELGPSDRLEDFPVYFDFGISAVVVSESISFGIHKLRPYFGFGPLIAIGWRINSDWGLRFKYSFLFCSFMDGASSLNFIAHDFSLIPRFRVLDITYFDVFVEAPVSVSWKIDAITVRVAVAVGIEFDFFSRLIRGKSVGEEV